MLPGVDIEHHDVRTRGARLHVAQAGSPDSDLVLLLHGFPDSWYGWRHQIPALVAAGYRVWAPDQRGYNLSEKPQDLSAYNLDALADDVIDLLDAAGAERAYLVGHDWGASVAWWVALRHPERIKKMAILNVPHGSVMLKTLRSNPAQLLRSWYGFFFQLPWLPERLMLANNAQLGINILVRTSNPGSFSDEDLAACRAAWQQPGAATGMLNWYRAFARRRPDPAPDPRVHVPTLILWGVNDVALMREMASASLDYCDEGELVSFENATHWLQHDEPERVNQHLIEFFGRGT
ncbi:MAG: alpha/beta hydrolase [Anaerolineae bacterium]|nr:alpha/beta hydrolase [Anaerolineae bacterium]